MRKCSFAGTTKAAMCTGCSGIGEDARMCPAYQRAARMAAERDRDKWRDLAVDAAGALSAVAAAQPELIAKKIRDAHVAEAMDREKGEEVCGA